jgi:hypothetical protein
MTEHDYDARCKAAADAQGLTPISSALNDMGIEHVIEQTGGFCMVIYIYGDPIEGARIGITTDCVIWYADENAESDDDRYETLLTHDDCIHGESGELPLGCFAETLTAVITNLDRVNTSIEVVRVTMPQLSAMAVIHTIKTFGECDDIDKKAYFEFLNYIHSWIDEEGAKTYHELEGDGTY